MNPAELSISKPIVGIMKGLNTILSGPSIVTEKMPELNGAEFVNIDLVYRVARIDTVSMDAAYPFPVETMAPQISIMIAPFRGGRPITVFGRSAVPGHEAEQVAELRDIPIGGMAIDAVAFFVFNPYGGQRPRAARVGPLSEYIGIMSAHISNSNKILNG